MMMMMVMMVMLMTLLEPLMIDDFDGALEMPDDGPLMKITLMVPCMDDDDLMYMMMLDLLDDGALAFDDGLGAMMEMT